MSRASARAAAERKPRLKQRSLTTELIDDGEHPKSPAAEQLVMDEIHAPTLVRTPRLRNGAAMQAHVFATTHSHADLQPFEAIPAIHALPVHVPALSSQHDVDALIAEARSGVRDLADAKSQCRLISRLALGIPPAMGKLPQLDRLAYAHRVALPDPLGQRASARWPQSFFRTTSPKMCLSSVSSATRRLSLAFSSRS